MRVHAHVCMHAPHIRMHARIACIKANACTHTHFQQQWVDKYNQDATIFIQHDAYKRNSDKQSSLFFIILLEFAMAAAEINDGRECVFTKPNTDECLNTMFREPTGRCSHLEENKRTLGMAGTPYKRLLQRYENGEKSMLPLF